EQKEAHVAIPEQYAHIQGWGADLDPADRPAVPMERKPPRLEDAPSGPPTQQAQRVEVLHSIERPGLSSVFGTSVPPSGLSGYMRRQAFKRSENDLRHWLMLIAADRVNAVEGVLEDARRSPGKALAIGAGFVVAAWWLSRASDR